MGMYGVMFVALARKSHTAHSPLIKLTHLFIIVVATSGKKRFIEIAQNSNERTHIVYSQGFSFFLFCSPGARFSRKIDSAYSDRNVLHVIECREANNSKIDFVERTFQHRLSDAPMECGTILNSRFIGIFPFDVIVSNFAISESVRSC